MDDLGAAIRKNNISTRTDLKLYATQLSTYSNRIKKMVPLTANENIMSNFARSFLCSNLESKYYFPNATKDGASTRIGDMFLQDLTGLRDIIEQANGYLCNALGAKKIEMRLLSGVHAMIVTILVGTNVGDVVYSLPPRFGGHFATSNIVQRLGRVSKFLPWDESSWDINFAQLANYYSNEKSSMIFLDLSCHLYPINTIKLRKVAENSLIVYDASHSLGLITGGVFQSPLEEGCDILQGNTHKTFPGPQKAIITFKDLNLANKFSQALSEGLVSSCHSHHLASYAVTCLEMAEYGKEYAEQIVKNAQAFANHLELKGAKLLRRNDIPTASHIIMMESFNDHTAKDCIYKLLKTGLINASTKLYDEKLIVRLGLQELTRLGLKEYDCKNLVNIISKTILSNRVKSTAYEISEFMKPFKKVKYSFD